MNINEMNRIGYWVFAGIFAGTILWVSVVVLIPIPLEFRLLMDGMLFRPSVWGFVGGIIGMIIGYIHYLKK